MERNVDLASEREVRTRDVSDVCSGVESMQDWETETSQLRSEIVNQQDHIEQFKDKQGEYDGNKTYCTKVLAHQVSGHRDAIADYKDQLSNTDACIERNEHIIEDLIDVPVPCVKEEIPEALKHIPQERVENNVVKQTVDVPVPQIQDHVVEEIIGIPVPRVMEDFSVTLELGVAKAEEVMAPASVTLIIQVVFAKVFGTDVSMITVSSVEVTSASAILVAFSATGSGVSISTMSESSTRVIGLFNQEFVNRGLNYTVSSVSANVVGAVERTSLGCFQGRCRVCRSA